MTGYFSLVDIIYNWVYLLLLVVLLLIAVAFFTVGERKLMGAIQRRKGPDVVGFWGILQPMADGLKLVVKELVFPVRASVFLFLAGPIVVFIVSLFGWIVIPHNEASLFSSISVAVLFTFVVSGLNIYGLVLAGWASNSRYAFLGAIRATAQMISYELVFGMINVIVILFSGSYNYLDIVQQQNNGIFLFPLFPVFIMFLIVMLAETNRTPFDLAEAEAELVAGYNVEYSSMMFALFFLGEYANMLLLSVVGALYFLGGWLPLVGVGSGGALWLFGKSLFFCITFVWVRATLPRYRYDQLMSIGWKILLPLIFGLFIFYAGLVVIVLV